MKELLTKIEEMTKVTEELKRTKKTTLEQGKKAALKKLNTLYNLLKPYSELAKLIPGYAAIYDVAIKDSKNNSAYITYRRNGQDWHIRTSATNIYDISLNQKELDDSDYKYYAVRYDYIQNINEEEVIKKVESKTIYMFQEYINRTKKEINDLNQAFESFQTQLSTTTITNILESLFDANSEFKNTGNLDLIEIISGYISTLENLLKGGE